MKEELRVKVDNMLELYLKIEKQFKWEHNLSKHFAALTYTQKNKEFDKEKIDITMKFIKSKTGVFSCYRGTSTFIIAMLLCSQYENPEEKFSEMMEYHDKLRRAGFKSSMYLPIANYALLITNEDNFVDSRVSQAYELYCDMKKNHPWLTSGDDYALSILLSRYNKSVNTIEEYYKSLNKLGFSKGNGLQLLSHILSFSNEEVNVITARCKKVYNKLKENKLKIYSDFYASLGLIALLDGDGNITDDLVKVAQYLNKQKKYKWLGKGMNVLIASAIVSEEYINNNELIQTTLSISIEALIAAQTSAAIAAITASTAAASAAN